MSGFQGVLSVGIGGPGPAPSRPLPIDQPRIPEPAAGRAERPGVWQESSGLAPGPAGLPRAPAYLWCISQGCWVCGDGGRA